MLNNATESSRACGRAGVIPPFLWFGARPKPPRSGVLDQATLALVPLNLDGYPTPQDPVQRLVSIDVKSGVEKQLATLDPPPDSILAGRISLHPDGNRLAVSFLRKIPPGKSGHINRFRPDRPAHLNNKIAAARSAFSSVPVTAPRGPCS
jgi:hypothetical protein